MGKSDRLLLALYALAALTCAAWVVLVYSKTAGECKVVRTIRVETVRTGECDAEAAAHSLAPREYERHAEYEGTDVFVPRGPYAITLPPHFADMLELGRPPKFGLWRPRVLRRLHPAPAGARAANVTPGLERGDDHECFARVRVTPEHLRGAAPLNFGRRLSCAVVGSDGSLAGSGCGAEIDGADVVFRANNPPLRGHEGDVGDRSDVMLLNRHWAGFFAKGEEDSGPNEVANLVRAGHQYGPVVTSEGVLLFNSESPWPVERDLARWMCTRRATSPFTHALAKANGWTVLHGSAEWDAALNGWMQRASGLEHGLATTGLQAVLAAAALCTDVRVYGFLPHDGPADYFASPKLKPWCVRTPNRAPRAPHTAQSPAPATRTRRRPHARAAHARTARRSLPRAPRVPAKMHVPPKTQTPKTQNDTSAGCPNRTELHDDAFERALLDDFAVRGVQLNLCDGEFPMNPRADLPPAEHESARRRGN